MCTACCQLFIDRCFLHISERVCTDSKLWKRPVPDVEWSYLEAICPYKKSGRGSIACALPRTQEPFAMGDTTTTTAKTNTITADTNHKQTNTVSRNPQTGGAKQPPYKCVPRAKSLAKC